jgi:putative salt-induced outer membrane protein YdiY
MTTARATCIAVFLGFVIPATAAAQDDEPEVGWHDVAEITFVLTDGNARSSTLGGKNLLEYLWANARFSFDAGGIRSESTTVERIAVGDSQEFRIAKQSDEEVTAENYFLRSRYDRNITDRFFWFVGGGWHRNTFAGIKNRYTGVGGIGNIWFESDVSGFRTDYGVTFTYQDNVEGDDQDFGGLRIGWDYWRQLTGNTRFDSVLLLDENLNEGSDFRTDFTNSLAVSMSEHLALKASYQVLFDNEPSGSLIPLVTLVGAPTETLVLAPLDEVDSIFTLALVIDM